jgi:hypothetical protein
MRPRKTLNKVYASLATKRKNGATYSDMKEQRCREKTLWTRDLRILTEK